MHLSLVVLFDVCSLLFSSLYLFFLTSLRRTYSTPPTSRAIYGKRTLKPGRASEQVLASGRLVRQLAPTFALLLPRVSSLLLYHSVCYTERAFFWFSRSFFSFPFFYSNSSSTIQMISLLSFLSNVVSSHPYTLLFLSHSFCQCDHIVEHDVRPLLFE